MVMRFTLLSLGIAAFIGMVSGCNIRTCEHGATCIDPGSGDDQTRACQNYCVRLSVCGAPQGNDITSCEDACLNRFATFPDDTRALCACTAQSLCSDVVEGRCTNPPPGDCAQNGSCSAGGSSSNASGGATSYAGSTSHTYGGTTGSASGGASANAGSGNASTSGGASTNGGATSGGASANGGATSGGATGSGEVPCSTPCDCMLGQACVQGYCVTVSSG